MIEAFSGTLKKNKSVENIKPYDVNVDWDIINQFEECLRVAGPATGVAGLNPLES